MSSSAEVSPESAPGGDADGPASHTGSVGRPAQVDSPGAPGPVGISAAPDWAHRPLAVQAVRLVAGLLHEWQQRNLSNSLPLALRQLQDAGNLDNVRLAVRAGEARQEADGHDDGHGNTGAHGPLGAQGPQGVRAGQRSQRPGAGIGLGPVDPLPGLGYRGPVFMDSDIYKTLEAIGWELVHGPRPDLAAFASEVISLLEQAQRPDGYLNSYFQVSGEPRYARLAWSHEMYCAGHLIQAALALHRGAADARLLDVAVKLADHLVREFGGQARGLDGHPIIESALAELYRETGTVAYLDLARQFVDQRGHGLAGDSSMGHRYLQDHMPVRDSATEVGHVVRALYLEAGVADVGAETGDRELLASSVRRWEDMVAAKTYLTGGNGSRHADEGFGDRFELPPDRAYNETCAAIASFHWSWRLLLATGDARYADHMERVLYNGFGAAIARDGERFFYVNPLQRREDHFEKDEPGRRRSWFSCACCPPNIMRLLASLQNYLATTSGDTLYLHLLTGSLITGAGLEVEVATQYPWDGRVQVVVAGAPEGERGIAIRVPPWAASSRYWLNDDSERAVVTAPGYLLLRRRWRRGDMITLDLGIVPRWTFPDRRVDAVRGCVAIERGPLVYCFEQADQPDGAAVDDIVVPSAAGQPAAGLAERALSVPGVGRTVLVTVAAAHVRDDPSDRAAGEPVTAVAIPYFQWDNRDGRAMRVWMPLKETRSTPLRGC